MMRTILEDSWTAARGAEVVVHHPKALGGSDIAERLGVRNVLAAPLPVLTPTRAFPAPGVVKRDLGGTFNRLTFGATRGIVLPFARLINRWRETALGLPRRRLFANAFTLDRKPIPVLYAFSSHVVPRPDDWPDTAHITGYWPLEEPADWSPPPELVSFLAAGRPPVYVGFGSMVGRDPARTTRVVLDGIARCGQRAILATGWGGIDTVDCPRSVHVTAEVPHSWLFPRVSSVVHHGGAGTTAAGLRAGKPTLICPFFGDQHFWGSRVHALGVGPEPIPQKHLTPANLAGAIDAMEVDDKLRQSAVDVTTRLAREDGVKRAVQIIQQITG